MYVFPAIFAISSGISFAVHDSSSYICACYLCNGVLCVKMSFIEFHNISKSFGGTVALDSVSLLLERGEVHALMGENGAGKSTLGKVLAGLLRPDQGTVNVNGAPVRFPSPREARQAGIGMVHQELAYCPDLTVAENLTLGRYPRRWRIFVDRSAMVRQACSMLADIAPEMDPSHLMRDLSVAQHQMVQIAAAVNSGATMLIFDEPTSSLSEPEAQRLFALIMRLKERGVTILYVSHRMAEVFSLCDRISVLRDGCLVGTVLGREADQNAIVRMMIGRQLEEYFPGHLGAPSSREVLRVDSLSSPGLFNNVSFAVHSGEILGIAGLVGSGRSQVASAIFGLDPHAKGSIHLNGRDISRFSVRARMRAGIALVPEDRKRQGLALMLSCRVNFSLTLLDLLRRWIFLHLRAESSMLTESFRKLSIKTASFENPVSSLSGGNQQKVVLAKWLARASSLLILDEPTRGVDVGAKAAIHALIEDLARQGRAIILISSELPEVINLSTRILVMRAGALAGEVQKRDATQERLMRMMSGLEPGAA
jgi:ABC-type sugar transport system ATPase subunit